MKQDEIVGFEDDANTIIKYLNEETKEIDVIPIVGMGGLGKTTLAKIVYRDAEIQQRFQITFWVCISQEFNVKSVLLTILKQLTTEDLSELSHSLLAEIVRNNLENRRFLLVLDDLHTTEDWRLIENALPKSNKLGKVIITTRNPRVAWEANYRRNPHRLSYLTLQESWELLQLQVFDKLEKCPSDLEDVGKKIAMKCQGLPLAIVVIGGILRRKLKLSTTDVMDEWKEVSSSLNNYLEKDYEIRTGSIIASTVHELPSELRSCFLYMGMFPKDSSISAWKLLRMWIAEGFITPKSGKSLEEVAEENLKHLVYRNLVIVEKTKAGGGIKTCRLSSMVHEFCTSQASIPEKNLFREVKRSADGVFDPPISEIQNYYRLCIHSCVGDFIHHKPKCPLVRSFLCFYNEAISLPPEYDAAIIEAFDCLRVLDVKPIKFSKFPSKITRLTHLRYIALSADNFHALPASVAKLWNLQTIIIDTVSRTLEIKAYIWKIISLRHIKTKAAIVIDNESKGKGGENLQTISRLSTQSFSEDICKRASNLKNLGIHGHLDSLLKTNYMARLDRLHKLKLLHDPYPNRASEDPLVSLPYPEAFPPNMRILELSSTFLEWKHMDTLGMLPTLEILKLKDNAFRGRLWEVNDGLFPSLEVLLIKHTDLEAWTASPDSFPRLECLKLDSCKKLIEIPYVLAKNLQVLDIEHVSKSAVESAKRIKKEKLQMQDQPRAKIAEFNLKIEPADV